MSTGVTKRSSFWENDGVISVMAVHVSILVAAILGTKTFLNKSTTTFCLAVSSNALHLSFPFLVKVAMTFLESEYNWSELNRRRGEAC